MAPVAPAPLPPAPPPVAAAPPPPPAHVPAPNFPAPVTVGRPYLNPPPPPRRPPTTADKPKPPSSAPGYREPLGPRRLGPDEPAIVFANMTSAQCRKEVLARKLPVSFEKKGYASVGLPVRITGPFHGLVIRTAPKSSKYGVLDCRLALALDELGYRHSSPLRDDFRDLVLGDLFTHQPSVL